MPPTVVINTMLSRDTSEYGGALRVDRVVDAPVVSANGEVIDQPGYHAGSRLFYRPARGLEKIELGNVDTVDDLTDARDFLLNEWLGVMAAQAQGPAVR